MTTAARDGDRPQMISSHRGAIARFDETSGLGVVRDVDGSTYPFHCTAIADGTRTIKVRTKVSFLLATGQLGRIEARDIAPLREHHA